MITDQDRLDLIYKTIYYDSTYNPTTPSGAIDPTVMYSLLDLGAIASVNNGVNLTDFTLDAARSTTGSKCYTYNTVLNEGDEVIVFTNIVIPTDWNQTQM